MNKLKFLLRCTLALLLFGAVFANRANAQCTITAKADGCVGVGVQFSVSGAATVGAIDSIVWTFSNGSTRTSVPTGVTNVWSAPTGGPSVVTVTIYKGGSTTPACVATHNVTIHANPVADFNNISPSPQCFNGNCFNFQDVSQKPSGNPIVWREFVFGDGGKQIDSPSIPGIIGCYRYVPPTPAGGKFTPQMTIRDSKGCISFVEKQALIEIKPDIGADFSTPNPKQCLFTPTNFTNTSLVTQANTKKFIWDFGDGTIDSSQTRWSGFVHTYTKNGCFNAQLIIEALDGCKDTAKKQAACNVAPILDVSVANGDIQCATGQQFVFSHPAIQGAAFLWNFDDPPTGPLNFDNKNWTTTHNFSSTGPFDVRFTLFTQGPACQFDTVYRVHVKGPLAGIETKPAPVIPPSQRYQCKITDTVYFPNISSYYLNDDSAFNDFYYTVGGGIFQFITLTTAHVDFDTIALNTPRNFTTRTGRKVYVNGDTVAVNGDTMILQGTYLVKGTDMSDRDAFFSKNSHTTRIWDFADAVAPQCTTDSRPIYPKSAANGNLHWPTSPAPAWTYDANGKWYNCNFNRDSLPKHWYTPGQERCYQVRLILEDTSKPDPNIKTLTSTQNDPSCQSEATVNLALQGPDASGLRMKKDPCYGSPNVYGIEFFFDRTGPACDRQFFWIHLDSTADRVDNTPNVFDKWIPQTGTVVDRMFTPWPMATMNLPPNVGSIYWQYSAQGGYPSKIADKSGWVTVGLRIQNGIDPTTGQPCIDEKWYHNAYRYIQAEPDYKFYSLNKPDSLYTFERLCSPNDIYVKRNKLAISLQGGLTDSTYASDSVGVDSWSWSNTAAPITGGYLESGALVDSFHRYMCDSLSNYCYSYVMRYEFKADGSVVLLDSVVTRVWDKTTKQTISVTPMDSIPDVIKKIRINSPGRYDVRHALITCQSEERLVDGAMKRVKTCCDNPYFEASHIAVLGFFSNLNLNDSIVCRNQEIQFFDSARYYLENDIPTYPFILDDHDWWDNPLLYPSGANRPRPRPFPADYEKLRWDFGDGTGWNSSVPDNPLRAFPEPGIYTVKLELSDSIGCKQVETRNVTITGVSANFSTPNKKLTNCRPTVDFLDTSLMLDPCSLVRNTTCDEIVKWEWNFGDNKPNNQSISILQNPSKIYTSFGDFDVTLVVTTKLGCKDSIKRTISLEGPRPRFEFAADSVGCRPFTVELRNTSINPSPNANWIWYFGDGKFLNDNTGKDVTHTYDTAGTFEIILFQEDQTPLGTNKCNAIFPDTNLTNGNYRKFEVRVLPSRKTAFTVSDSIVCVNDSVTFTSSSDTIYSDYVWVTGIPGDTIKKTKVNGGDVAGKRYTSPGTYYVQLRPKYTPPFGEPACPTSAVRRVLVRDVEAKFACDTANIPVMNFVNQSRNAAKIWWDFGTGDGFEDGNARPDYPNANYNYGENKGFYTVLLAVESPEGCLDTAFCQFVYDYKVAINPPNIFTPGNADGTSLNEMFDVRIENEEAYKIGIYNRWGEKVFEAENKDAMWDGKHIATGSDCPPGVYFVVINYRLRGQSDKVYRGTLTLKRD